MDEGDGLKDDLSQCGCDTCVMKDKTSNSVQACSDPAHVVLVLVGVRRVTVVIVHIGLEGILVVKHFCNLDLPMPHMDTEPYERKLLQQEEE